VDEDYIKDSFNLYGLSSQFQNYKFFIFSPYFSHFSLIFPNNPIFSSYFDFPSEALSMVLSEECPTELELKDER
jgi:hypothetical protein